MRLHLSDGPSPRGSRQGLTGSPEQAPPYRQVPGKVHPPSVQNMLVKLVTAGNNWTRLGRLLLPPPQVTSDE